MIELLIIVAYLTLFVVITAFVGTLSVAFFILQVVYEKIRNG